MQIPPDALGLFVVVATLVGSAFAVKILVWGKGPILRSSRRPEDERLEALDEHVRQLLAMVGDQSDRIEDLSERLDFTERLLSRGWNGATPAPSGQVASRPRASTEEPT